MKEGGPTDILDFSSIMYQGGLARSLGNRGKLQPSMRGCPPPQEKAGSGEKSRGGRLKQQLEKGGASAEEAAPKATVNKPASIALATRQLVTQPEGACTEAVWAEKVKIHVKGGGQQAAAGASYPAPGQDTCALAHDWRPCPLEEHGSQKRCKDTHGQY